MQTCLTVLLQVSNIPSQEFLFISLDDTAYSHKIENYNIFHFFYFCLWEEKRLNWNPLILIQFTK